MMKNHPNLFSLCVVAPFLIIVIVVPFLPILISRHWGWWEAWVFAVITILAFVISRLMAASQHPDLIRERSRFMQSDNVPSWDKMLASFILSGWAFVLLVVGFDALFGWSRGFSLPWKLLALALILFGYILSSYALVENRFFSGNVRIQNERGHSVVSSGPYRFMRHPGYAGGLLIYLAMPFFLDSTWAIIPAILMIVFVFVRTFLEDSYLLEALDGYREYAARVRYRLIPGVW